MFVAGKKTGAAKRGVGFIDDYSTPEDLNVSLPSSVSGDATALHASIRAFRLVAEFFQRFFGIKGR